jgi:hypothetical protein
MSFSLDIRNLAAIAAGRAVGASNVDEMSKLAAAATRKLAVRTVAAQLGSAGRHT